MKIVKLYLGNNQVIPQTTAEAVAVLDKGQVLTLDKVLNKKLEKVTPVENSGITILENGINITIDHTNKVEPLLTPKAKIIAYDSNGHITQSKDLGKHTILVNDNVITEYTGNEDKQTEFGDDFTIKDSRIQLQWNNI